MFFCVSLYVHVSNTTLFAIDGGRSELSPSIIISQLLRLQAFLSIEVRQLFDQVETLVRFSLFLQQRLKEASAYFED